MADILLRFYRRHIKVFDPLNTQLAWTLKTMAGMAVALGLGMWFFGEHREPITWCLLGCVFTSMVRQGPTPGARRLIMLGTLAVMACLIPLCSWAGLSIPVSTLVVGILVFTVVYSTTLSKEHYSVCVWVLIPCLVAMGMPKPFFEAFIRSKAVLLGGSVAWLIHQLLAPAQPRILIQRARRAALEELLALAGTYRLCWTRPGEPSSSLNDLEASAANMVEVYRRLSAALGMIAPHPDPGRVLAGLKTLKPPRLAETSSVVPPQLDQAWGLIIKHLQAWTRAALGEAGYPEAQPVREGLQKNQSDFLEYLVKTGRETNDLETRLARHGLFFTMDTFVSLLARAQEAVSPECQSELKESWFTSLRRGFHPGAHPWRMACQAGLAAGAAMLLVGFFELERGYWLVILVVFSVQGSLGESVRLGLYRLGGTLTAAAVGIAFLMLFGNVAWLLYSILGLSILGAFYLMRSPYKGLAFFFSTLMIVLAISSLDPHGWKVGWLRSWETLAALVLGLLAGHWVWPNRAWLSLKQGLAQGAMQMAGLLEMAPEALVPGKAPTMDWRRSFAEFRANLLKMKGWANVSALEPGVNPESLARARDALAGLEDAAWLLGSRAASVEVLEYPAGGEALGLVVAEHRQKLARAFKEASRIWQRTGRPMPPVDFQEDYARLLQEVRIIKNLYTEPGPEEKTLISRLAALLWREKAWEQALASLAGWNEKPA